MIVISYQAFWVVTACSSFEASSLQNAHFSLLELGAYQIDSSVQEAPLASPGTKEGEALRERG